MKSTQYVIRQIHYMMDPALVQQIITEVMLLQQKSNTHLIHITPL